MVKRFWVFVVAFVLMAELTTMATAQQKSSAPKGGRV